MDDVPTTLVLPSEEGKDAKDASPPLAVQRDSRRSVRRQRSKLAAVAWELERRQTASRSVRWTRAQVVSHVLLFLSLGPEVNGLRTDLYAKVGQVCVVLFLA